MHAVKKKLSRMAHQFCLANWNEDNSPTRDARALSYLIASNSPSSVAFNNPTGLAGNQTMLLNTNPTNNTTSHTTNEDYYHFPMVNPTITNISNYNDNQTSPSHDSSPPRLFGSSLILAPTTRRSTARYINTTRPSSMNSSMAQLGADASNYHQVQSRKTNNNNGISTSFDNSRNNDVVASATITSIGTGNAFLKRSRSSEFVRGESSNQSSQVGGAFRRRTNPPPPSFQHEIVNNNSNNSGFSRGETQVAVTTSPFPRNNNFLSSEVVSSLSSRSPRWEFNSFSNTNNNNNNNINTNLNIFDPTEQRFDDTFNHSTINVQQYVRLLPGGHVDRFLAPSIVHVRSNNFVPRGSQPPSNPSTSSNRLNPPSAPTVVESDQYMEPGTILAGQGNRRRGNNHIFTSTSPELRARRNRLRDEHLRAGGSMRRQDMLTMDYSIVLNVFDSFERINMLHNIVDWPYEALLALEEHIRRVETGLTEEEIHAYIETEIYVSNPNETSTQNKTCTICQEDYVEGEIIGRLDCRHLYHLDFIKQWLLQKNSCPICKRIALDVHEDEDESD
ncbi:uncharacterized protein LOC131650135 [Vicia villosa]|uniref:uncharacterized protein LOC131650135 n=1 Tax=Vicia villosa TaxID=3911 RepID=UPI00273C01D3|nr:uncharacterized protein LOC131650135 [Vicia villosa]